MCGEDLGEIPRPGGDDQCRPGREHPIDSIAAKVIDSHLSAGKMFAGLAHNYLSTGHFQLAAENLSAARRALADASQALQSFTASAGSERRVSLEATMCKLAASLAELSAKLEARSAGPAI